MTTIQTQEEIIMADTVETLTAKLAELTSMINSVAAKMTEQGVAQENLASKLSKLTTESELTDVGLDEFAKLFTENMLNNTKRTADEYQDLALSRARKNDQHFDKLTTDSQDQTNKLNVITNQALQNAVENTNALAKQMIRHSDIAIDRQWNVDEVAALFQKIMAGIVDPNVAAAMATAIANALMKKA